MVALSASGLVWERCAPHTVVRNCSDVMTVGIDGVFGRTRSQAGFYEVIAGKSLVASRRNEEQDRPPAKRFGFVQTYDTKPRRCL